MTPEESRPEPTTRDLLLENGALAVVRAGERVGHFRLAAELPRVAREYRGAGLPWTANDLRPVADPEALRAGVLLREGTQEILRGGWGRNDAALQAAIDADDLASAETVLARYAPTLARFEAAAEIGRLDFGRDLDAGSGTLLPEHPQLKAAVKTLGYRARVRAVRNDPDGARRDLEAMRTIARMIEDERPIPATFLRIGCDRLADEAARLAAARAPRLAEGALADLERASTGPGARPDLGQKLRQEAFLALATVRNVTARFDPEDLQEGSFAVHPDSRWVPDPGPRTSLEKDPARLRRDGLPTGLTERACAARLFAIWTRIAGAMRSFSDDPLRLGIGVDRILWPEGWDAMDPRPVERDPADLLLERVVPLAFRVGEATKAGVVVATWEANRAITRAYLGALAARLRTGAWPEPLIAGNDPFGNPYVGRREGSGFRIYSRGPNGRDDGGLTSAEILARGPFAMADRSDDIAVLYPPFRRRARG